MECKIIVNKDYIVARYVTKELHFYLSSLTKLDNVSNAQLVRPFVWEDHRLAHSLDTGERAISVRFSLSAFMIALACNIVMQTNLIEE